MTTRIIAICLLGAGFLGGEAATAAEDQRLNLVFILADDKY